MSHRGNRPDCAYFLLIGIAISAFFITMGGVCTYVAYWPETALAHYTFQHLKHHFNHREQEANTYKSHSSDNNNEDPQLAIANYDIEKSLERQESENIALKILGPFCLTFGFLILAFVGAYAMKYRCDHEPETNIAFLRLASEMSLNLDPEKRQYELMVEPGPSGLRKDKSDTEPKF